MSQVRVVGTDRARSGCDSSSCWAKLVRWARHAVPLLIQGSIATVNVDVHSTCARGSFHIEALSVLVFDLTSERIVTPLL